MGSDSRDIPLTLSHELKQLKSVKRTVKQTAGYLRNKVVKTSRTTQK